MAERLRGRDLFIVHQRNAHFDPSLRATIVARRPLRYRRGADHALDRPEHLRAGSSISWIGERLAVVQDDANFIALVDPATGLADAITLPAGELGLRQFDDVRGNKRFKLDLEACCVLPTATGPMLVALGSGSKSRRRNIAAVDCWEDADPRVRMIDASALYAALEATVDFSGSDMNIEGAVAFGDTLRLFARGNGRVKHGRVPLNATCDLDLSALLKFLGDPAGSPAPAPRAIVQFELGTHEGLALGFTDATRAGRTLLYTAAAEASSSAEDDGEVRGSVVGVLPDRGDVRYAPLTDARGAPTRDKVEGLVPVPGTDSRLFVVIDADDATRPSELCEVRLEGDWY